VPRDASVPEDDAQIDDVAVGDPAQREPVAQACAARATRLAPRDPYPFAPLRDEKLMVNELYLSTVYRPTSGMATGLASKLLKGTAPGASAFELADALEACAKLRETLRASLARYEPEVLSLYARAGRTCSGPLSFLATLINGEVRDVPLPR